jgi:hypothetical protein
MTRRADYVEALAEVERAIAALKHAPKEITPSVRRLVTQLDRAVEQLKATTRTEPKTAPEELLPREG